MDRLTTHGESLIRRARHDIARVAANQVDIRRDSSRALAKPHDAQSHTSNDDQRDHHIHDGSTHGANYHKSSFKRRETLQFQYPRNTPRRRSPNHPVRSAARGARSRVAGDAPTPRYWPAWPARPALLGLWPQEWLTAARSPAGCDRRWRGGWATGGPAAGAALPGWPLPRRTACGPAR